MPEKEKCQNCGVQLPDASAAGGMCPVCEMNERLTMDDQDMTIATDAQAYPSTGLQMQGFIGKTFGQGRYAIVGLMVQGGMGAVFHGREAHLNRDVAIKVLSQEYCEDQTFVQRFEREAKTLAAFDHPHIVPIYDYGQEDGAYYIVMGFVSGPNGKANSLNDLIQSQGGSLPPEMAIRIMEQACSALEYAHQKKVVHRDIKPGNLLIDSQGNVRLADFGIASNIDRPGDHTLTGSGAVLGSLRYISPEQRDDPANVDGRSDLFSLGKVFYKMLTGKVPEGNHIKASASGPGIDKRFDEVIDKALMQDPNRRFSSAAEMGAQIASLRKPTESLVAKRMRLVATQAPSWYPLATLATGLALCWYLSLLLFSWPVATLLTLISAAVVGQIMRDSRMT